MKKNVLSLIVLFCIFPASAYMQIPGEEFFKDRRERFMQAMDGGIAVFPGKVRQDDGLRNENQAKYFYYLTGCEMNGAWLFS